IATLDNVSGGRTELAWGVGWHEEEFLANGSRFKGRYAVLEEQVAVCRAVWDTPPAAHHGPGVSFDNLYSMPLPVQGRNIPIWFGMDPTPRNIERIARLADGWAPLPLPPASIGEAVTRISAALERHGRSSEGFPVRATLLPVSDAAGDVDLAASLATVPEYLEAGVTMIICDVQSYCTTVSQVDEFIDAVVRVRDAEAVAL